MWAFLIGGFWALCTSLVGDFLALWVFLVVTHVGQGQALWTRSN